MASTRIGMNRIFLIDPFARQEQKGNLIFVWGIPIKGILFGYP